MQLTYFDVKRAKLSVKIDCLQNISAVFEI